MNPWRTRCPVCKQMRIVKKGVIQSHPKIDNSGKCPGSGRKHGK